ncbi:MAG: P-II family nitrogen regulator [Elusimicrobia bacterium]|nr:P-II family nitrogen regulator [Elusimicrobiota bacterium]
MKRIVAVFPPERLEKVKRVLYPLNIGGMIISEVKGLGISRGQKKLRRMRFFEFPKVKLEIIVREPEVAKAVDLLLETIQTGRIGDGKIFISDMESVIRIRTGESGEKAV